MLVRKYNMTPGRPKKDYTVTNKLRPTQRLVTVYRVNYPGMEKVQEYYRYDYPLTEEHLYVESCPGCGKKLGYRVAEHKCAGTLTDRPLDIKMPVGRPRTKQQKDKMLSHYLSTLDHPIHLTD